MKASQKPKTNKVD